MTYAETTSAVRRATAADMPILTRLCFAFWSTHFPEVPYDPPHFLAYIERNLDNENLFVAILGEGDGMLMACIVPTIFSTRLMVREIVWYTEPSARGRGMPLYRACERWARASKVEHMMCTLPWVEPAMERLGYKMAEVSYFKTLSTSASSAS
ncbi:MAG: GNAT family N-acetyltransferase [Paracoccaceae bacterium]